jgi:hypothetical protein
VPAIALFVGFFALARRSDAWNRGVERSDNHHR